MRNALNKTTTKIKLKNRRTFERLVGLLEEKVEIEDIAEWTEIDLYSKKLDLLSHLEMMVWRLIKDCEKLRELSDALKGVDAKKDGLAQMRGVTGTFPVPDTFFLNIFIIFVHARHHIYNGKEHINLLKNTVKMMCIECFYCLSFVLL